MNRRDFIEKLGWGGAALGLFQSCGLSRRSDSPLRHGLGPFRWTTGPPLLGPADRPEDPCHAVKDPTIVSYEGRWHLFSTIRSLKRSHQIEYSSFGSFEQAGAADRRILRLTEGYAAAPQVFYFSPHNRWYLIFQLVDRGRTPGLQPAFATNVNVSDPDAWSAPELLYTSGTANIEGWLDFWVICDESRAHLFFTSLDGLMWRAQTRIEDFPRGWGAPQVVLEADVFEASHTYRVRGREIYLTVIESLAGGLVSRAWAVARGYPGVPRYYTAYASDRLDGAWVPVASTPAEPFAAPSNVRQTGPHWTDSVSHGELIRSGHDEKLEIDPERLRFIFQGATEAERKGKDYGQIPWKLGLLES